MQNHPCRHPSTPATFTPSRDGLISCRRPPPGRRGRRRIHPRLPAAAHADTDPQDVSGCLQQGEPIPRYGWTLRADRRIGGCTARVRANGVFPGTRTMSVRAIRSGATEFLQSRVSGIAGRGVRAVLRPEGACGAARRHQALARPARSSGDADPAGNWPRFPALQLTIRKDSKHGYDQYRR